MSCKKFSSILFSMMLLFSSSLFGGIFTLADGNSTASFDTDSQSGMFSWKVDGVEHGFQQWFWYRVGASAEAPLNTLPHSMEGTSDTNSDGVDDLLFVQFVGNGFTIEISFALSGGSAGSGNATIAEEITIRNTGTDPLDFHFFQYSDLDLGATFFDDTGLFVDNNTVRQTDPSVFFQETVVTPGTSHREVGLFNDLIDPTAPNSLNDAGPTTLSDLTGPVTGDVTWAFQWDVEIPVDGSFVIRKRKQITVPEPASLVLLGLGTLALTGYGVMRRRSD